MRRVWVVLLLIACTATAVGSARGLGRIVEVDRGADELLYLPNGKFLKVASLGQAPVPVSYTHLTLPTTPYV